MAGEWTDGEYEMVSHWESDSISVTIGRYTGKYHYMRRYFRVLWVESGLHGLRQEFFQADLEEARAKFSELKTRAREIIRERGLRPEEFRVETL